MRERTRKRGSVCTCTGEEERRKGKLGVQETDFFVFYFCLINLLFLVSQRGKTQSECQRTRLPASACVCFLFFEKRRDAALISHIDPMVMTAAVDMKPTLTIIKAEKMDGE